MMRTGDETPEQEKARFKESRRFGKAVSEILGDAPNIVFEHVGKATFPTSVLTVKPFGKVVICAGTTGFNLDFDVRYLWMKQKQIIGSHFANAWECNKANALIESGQIRPVLWNTYGFDGVALLKYPQSPRESLDYIAREMGLHFNHQRRTDVRPSWPDELDQNRITREVFLKLALSGYPGTLAGFEPRALDWAASLGLDASRRRHLLSQLKRSDIANLPRLVADDLDAPHSGPFGSLPIHAAMLKSHRDQVLNYYAQVSPQLLPLLRDRPVTRVRG